MGSESGARAVCGSIRKLKTFPRVLFCIILLNVALAAVYFSPVFSYRAPSTVRQDYVVQGSKKIQLSANLMGHKIRKITPASTPKPNVPKENVGDYEINNEGTVTGEEDGFGNTAIIIDAEEARGRLDVLPIRKTQSLKRQDSKGQSQESPMKFSGKDGLQISKIKQGPSLGVGVDSPELTNENGRRRLKKLDEDMDTNHPQFSLAFPRHVKPLHLLNWTAPIHSDSYFQPIDDELAWLYSAFYDARLEVGQVRVFGIALRDLTGRVFCHFLGTQGEDLVLQKGRMKRMKDSHGANFSAIEVLCPAKEKLRPVSVRVTFFEDSPMPTNQLKIWYSGHQIRNFTVCFPPVHSNYSQLTQMVQIIELSKVIGADHFFVYNFSMSSQVGEVLEEYQSQGLVTILPWPLPVMETWYYGQVLAINDCIYRNMGISKYVVVTDTDEVIIPHVHLSWMTLLDNVEKHPWQRDDEFKDPDLSPGSPYLRSINFESEELEEQEEQEMKEAGRKIISKRFRGRISDTHLRGDEEEEEDGGHVNFVSPAKDETSFIRSNDRFPSNSMSKPSSRNLLAYEPDLGDDDLLSANDLRFGSFSFRCAFFSEKHPKREQMKELTHFVFSQQEKDLYARMPKCPMTNLIRIDTIFEHGQRSKVIVRPELVVSTGIHKVIFHIDGYQTAYVEPEIALLHHYRRYKVADCNTLDTSALNFKEKFYENLKSVVQKFPSMFPT